MISLYNTFYADKLNVTIIKRLLTLYPMLFL